MKIKPAITEFSKVVMQRNILLGLTLALTLIVMVQAIALLNQERTVVIVPNVKNSYEIQTSGDFSVAYLEDMAVAQVYNFTNSSPETFNFNKKKILMNASPEHRGVLEKYLNETHVVLKQRGMSTAFRIGKVVAVPKQKKVRIYGQLLAFIGSKAVDEFNKGFEVSFVNRGTTLLLSDFKEINYEK